MKRYRFYFIIFILTLTFSPVHSQNSQTMFYMNLPQNHLLNPAIQPYSRLYIGLPGISGVNMNFSNNFFNYRDIFSLNSTGDSTISPGHPDFDAGNFIDGLRETNRIEAGSSVQLFGLGISAGRDLYIFLDINERFEADFGLPGDMLRLLFSGNDAFLGRSLNLNSLATDVSWYRETGLGFSKNITGRLRIGVRAKWLSGVANMSLENKALNITVREDFTHLVDASLMANISAPVEIHSDAENLPDDISFDDSVFDNTRAIVDYFLKTGNNGLGLDLGLEYIFSDRFRLSASVTDLGYIRWKRDLTNLRSENQFVLSGVSFQDIYDGNIDFGELGQEIIDSLQKAFSVTSTAIPYRTNIPAGLILGAGYSPSGSLTLGLLSHTRFDGNRFRETFTFSASLNLGNTFSTSLAYTAASYSYDNIGFGLAFRLGFFQIYALADRIPLKWNKFVSGSDSAPVPEYLSTLHARAGVNLVFGNREKRKNDKPMIMTQ